jgi:hypothetical protein
MDTILEIMIVGAWIWVTVVSLVTVMSERRRWHYEHPAHGTCTAEEGKG